MKLERLEIDWMEGWGNLPRLVAHVDKMLDHDELRYKTYQIHGGTLYWAQKDVWVNFFYHTPGDESGYGGRVFSGTLEDGSTYSVKGPWSSSSHSMNKHFPPCVETVVYERLGQYPKLGYHGWNLTWEAALCNLSIDVATPTLISDFGRDNEVSAAEAEHLMARGMEGEVVGGYYLTFKRPDCKTLKESQEKKAAAKKLWG